MNEAIEILRAIRAEISAQILNCTDSDTAQTLKVWGEQLQTAAEIMHIAVAEHSRLDEKFESIRRQAVQDHRAEIYFEGYADGHRKGIADEQRLQKLSICSVCKPIEYEAEQFIEAQESLYQKQRVLEGV